MKYEKIGVCHFCGTEFVKARHERKYCSRRCAYSDVNRVARGTNSKEIAENGTDCPYNMAIVCSERKCGSCGWNPKVEKKRRENRGKR